MSCLLLLEVATIPLTIPQTIPQTIKKDPVVRDYWCETILHSNEIHYVKPIV